MTICKSAYVIFSVIRRKSFLNLTEIAMQNVAATGPELGNEEFGVETESSYAGRHAMVPVLLGLLAPVIVLSLVDPRALANVSVILHIYLFLIFGIAVAVYIYTVFAPGDITKVTFQKRQRVVIAERAGLFATTKSEIPFSDIASVRVENRYDDDGYETPVPVIVLTDHKVLQLPAGTTEADVATMRSLMRRDQR